MSDETNVNLNDVVLDSGVIVGAEFADKDAVLREIARLAHQASVLTQVSEDTIYRELKEREALGSTGFGDGIAMPHCHLEGIADFTVGCITVPRGVDFDSMDGDPVKLIVFMISPKEKNRLHVRLLSRISQAMTSRGAIQNLLACETADELREMIVTLAEPETREKKKQRTMNLVHVFMQNEDLFEVLLQVFLGLDASSLQVTETRSPSSYLKKVPLFSGLWMDDDVKYAKEIKALVDQRLANELIRRIEQHTGPLDERDDIAVSIQQLRFAAGTLSF